MLWVALLAEGVDRNQKSLARATEGCTSPSSRRAWIEIMEHPVFYVRYNVALLAEGVDRNGLTISPNLSAKLVALLAEGVDRNCP